MLLEDNGKQAKGKIIKQVAIGDGTDTIIYIEQEPGSGGKESAEATIRNLAGFRCIRIDRQEIK